MPRRVLEFPWISEVPSNPQLTLWMLQITLNQKYVQSEGLFKKTKDLCTLSQKIFCNLKLIGVSVTLKGLIGLRRLINRHRSFTVRSWNLFAAFKKQCTVFTNFPSQVKNSAINFFFVKMELSKNVTTEVFFWQAF